MFGYGIKFYKKSKGVKVEPVVEKPKEDPEYVKWQAEQKRLKEKENYTHNRDLIYKHINLTVEEYALKFEKEVPKPFEVGESVTFRYYDSDYYNPFSLGWYGSPRQMPKTFDAPILDGPITFPVHKILVSTDWLQDKIHDRCSAIYERMMSETEIINMVSDAFRAIQRNNEKKFLAEWIIDFDWKTLKIPVGICANEEGWLDLKWGGFNAGYFRSAETPIAKKQVELWEKERAFKEAEKKYKEDIEKLKREFEDERAKLFL